MAYKRIFTLVLLIAATLGVSGGEAFAVSTTAVPAATSSPAATQTPASTPGSTGTTAAPTTPLPQATPIEPPNTTSQTPPDSSSCTFNGKPISCSQAGKYAGGIFGGFLLIFIGFFVLSILTSIFWILMLVHAAKHPIEDKPLWIVVLALTGFVGAIVYYYVVKRPYDKHPVAAPTAWQPPAAPPPPPVVPPAPQPTMAPAAPTPPQAGEASEAETGIDASQFHS